MKQFNLKEYLENPKRKVITRDGRDARIICTDRQGGDRPILALCFASDGIENCFSCFPNGRWYVDTDSCMDLFFATEKHEMWINVYKTKKEDTYFVIATSLYLSKQEAKDCAISSNNSYDYIDAVKIEWED